MVAQKPGDLDLDGSSTHSLPIRRSILEQSIDGPERVGALEGFRMLATPRIM